MLVLRFSPKLWHGLLAIPYELDMGDGQHSVLGITEKGLMRWSFQFDSPPVSGNLRRKIRRWWVPKVEGDCIAKGNINSFSDPGLTVDPTRHCIGWVSLRHGYRHVEGQETFKAPVPCTIFCLADGRHAFTVNQTMKTHPQNHTPDECSDTVSCLTFSISGQYLVAGTYDARILVANFEQRWQWVNHLIVPHRNQDRERVTNEVEALSVLDSTIAVLHGGKIFVWVSECYSLKWLPEKPNCSIECHRYPQLISLSPDGQRIAVFCRGPRRIFVYEVGEGEVLKEEFVWSCQTAHVYVLRFVDAELVMYGTKNEVHAKFVPQSSGPARSAMIVEE